MNCVAVRERLPEHAMSVLDMHDLAAVERHLQWCAGCRKEAAELAQASATLGFALAPVETPEELEDRVVEAVRDAVGSPPGSRRRVRPAAASVVAAMVAVAALGWGAVMTGRADRLRDQAAAAEETSARQAAALVRFQKVLTGLGLSAPKDATRFASLVPTAGRQGGGAALVLVSPRIIDFAMVIVNGLEPNETYRITLGNADGVTITVGRIHELDRAGGAEVFHQFNRDLRAFTDVLVRNAAGAVVLQGTLGPSSELATP